MGIKITRKTTVDVDCDYPGGCANSFETSTEEGLVNALTSVGWLVVSDKEAYCPDHVALAQAKGLAGPRNG